MVLKGPASSEEYTMMYCLYSRYCVLFVLLQGKAFVGYFLISLSLLNRRLLSFDNTRNLINFVFFIFFDDECDFHLGDTLEEI